MDIFKKALHSFSPLRKLMSSGGLTFIFRIGGLGLNFLITKLITLYYGDAVFGSYSLAFTLAQATSLLFALGFPNALVSYLGLKSINDPFSQHMLKKGLKILMGVAVIPFIVYFFGANIIADYVFNKPDFALYITILAYTVPVMILHEFILYFFIATGNFLKFNIFMFVVPNTILLILLGVVSNVPGHYSFIFYFAGILAVLLTEVFFAFKKHDKGKVHNLVSARQMIKYASPMMFSGIMLYLLNWTDVFMLGALVSEKELAHYNVAYKIASLSMLVTISMNVVLAPRIAAFYNEGNLAALHKTVKKTTHLIIILTLPVVVGIALFGNFILAYFGQGYTGAWTALIIIATGFLLNAMTGNVDQVLNMTGNQKLLQNITIVGFIVNVALNVVLIPSYGINGSAMASLVTNVIFNVTCVVYIKKKLGFYTFA